MILVTGANGFVGRELVLTLSNRMPLRLSVRGKTSISSVNDVDIVEGSLSSDFDWSEALSGISTVIHCAARVHVMNEESEDPLEEFRSINVQGTLNLANQAAKFGVQRFIFLSSIKVNGENSPLGGKFSADDTAAPEDFYGQSKYEAEVGLRKLSSETGMEVVIIRPPLVYGPGVKANFLSMMSWIYRGFPLPLGKVTDNRRSFVFLENLVDLIALCITHPAAANQTFLVSDDHDLSTVDLLRHLSAALGRRLIIFPMSLSLIVLAAKLIGKEEYGRRLCGSLQLDIGKTKSILGWKPLIAFDEGLRKTAHYFLKTRA